MWGFVTFTLISLGVTESFSFQLTFSFLKIFICQNFSFFFYFQPNLAIFTQFHAVFPCFCLWSLTPLISDQDPGTKIAVFPHLPSSYRTPVSFFHMPWLGQNIFPTCHDQWNRQNTKCLCILSLCTGLAYFLTFITQLWHWIYDHPGT